MKIGDTIHGFEFIKTEELPELSAKLHLAEYKKNGAELLFIERDDENKTFSITFKTTPEDDTGVFHILEHSVLCGSDKFPVKEPFVELLKGSVKTFLNAMTFPDKTMYPISSRNDKDFLNLTDVYMDAVFHPNAIRSPEIFMQEGWHYEISSEDEPLTYNGVVFNEMKGASSSVDEAEDEILGKMMFPDNCYGKNSGGAPEAIPTLTYEAFVAAHEKFYHPSNAKIILDGNVNLDETLALLDSYLKDYDRKDINVEIPYQKPLGEVVKTDYYELSQSESAEGRTRVTLGFSAYDFREKRKNLALAIILDAIGATNASPFKRRMLDSGICEDVCFSPYEDGMKENPLFIKIKNVGDGRGEEAVKLALDTLRDLIDEGFDKSAITASLNISEFSMREQDHATTPAGLIYSIAAHDSWLYGGTPADSLAFEEDYKFLREAIDTDYYERVLDEVIFNSKTRATLYMLPSKTLGDERRAREAGVLRDKKSAMTRAQIKEVIDGAKALKAWQESEDTEENLAKIPALTLADISENPENIETIVYKTEGSTVVYTPAQTRGITYAWLYFNASDFDKEELFCLSALTSLYKNFPTESYTEEELQTAIKSNLGSLATVTSVVTKNKKATPYLEVVASALSDKTPEMVAFIKETLLKSRFENKALLKKLLLQAKLGFMDSLTDSGHYFGMMRSGAYVSRENAINDIFGGIENYKMLKELVDNFDERADEFLDKIRRIAKKLLTKERLTLSYCGEENRALPEKIISLFASDGKLPEESKIEPLGKLCEGFVIPAQISYATASAQILERRDSIPGITSVARSILSYEFLWNTIRVKGGAYGAGFVARKNGIASFYSYRDPNPKASIQAYRDSANYLRHLADSGEDITNFIIGAIGDGDPILTPKLRGVLGINFYLSGQTYEDRKKHRREMLSATAADLKLAADIIDEISENGAICVIGAKDKISACEGLVKCVVEL